MVEGAPVWTREFDSRHIQDVFGSENDASVVIELLSWLICPVIEYCLQWLIYMWLRSYPGQSCSHNADPWAFPAFLVQSLRSLAVTSASLVEELDAEVQANVSCRILGAGLVRGGLDNHVRRSSRADDKPCLHHGSLELAGKRDWLCCTTTELIR